MTLSVPAPVRAMPRSGSSVKLAVASSVPPLNISWFATGAPGGVPRAVSAAIERVPAVMLVAPV